ncbi:MAG: hypothetical protein IAF58_16675 [Leptolyngbya sp.]|jgi:hypothetical protein|nr:hypothetical protein [Candidatus Melainabacteria bacterium]
MRQAILALSVLLLSSSSLPANAQACGDEGRWFHLKPPSWALASERKRAVHRMAKALRWYREHLGNKPICEQSNIQGIQWTQVNPPTR